jgi:hypothetical protein
VSRKWLETVQDWPALGAGRGYHVRIGEIEKIAAPPAMRVMLEFTDGEQAGRTESVMVSLPCRPGGVSASLLSATGVGVAVGTQFAPRDLVGRTVVAFFTRTPNGGLAAMRFEACPASAGG